MYTPRERGVPRRRRPLPARLPTNTRLLPLLFSNLFRVVATLLRATRALLLAAAECPQLRYLCSSSSSLRCRRQQRTVRTLLKAAHRHP